MDIMGPVGKTTKSNGVECIRSTDSQVKRLSGSCTHIDLLTSFVNLNSPFPLIG
jgi:hypothetical protein